MNEKIILNAFNVEHLISKFNPQKRECLVAILISLHFLEINIPNHCRSTVLKLTKYNK